MSERPVLTVAVVCGSQRARTGRVLAAVAGQTAVAELELVVVDLRPELGPLEWPAGLEGRVLTGPGFSYGQARERAARAARGSVIGFLEEHCHPRPGWAAALLEAHRRPWASVGYSFDNANPRSLASRIGYLAQYGQWADPPGGPVTALAGNNVSYRRDLLLDVADALGGLPETDFNVHAELRRRGYALAVAPAARAAHEHQEALLDLLRESHEYSRVLAAERARLADWTPTRRGYRALRILAAAPAVRLTGLVRVLVRRPSALTRAMAYVPGIVLVYLVAALGEAAGYALGEGAAYERYLFWELESPRAGGR